jgi:hypothetical protein
MSTKSEHDRVKSIKYASQEKSIENLLEEDSHYKHMNSVFGKPSKEDPDDDAYPTVEEWLEMPDHEKLNIVHDSLLELYLNVKIRNFDKTIDSDKVDVELDKLKNVETITLIEYIKS